MLTVTRLTLELSADTPPQPAVDRVRDRLQDLAGVVEVAVQESSAAQVQSVQLVVETAPTPERARYIEFLRGRFPALRAVDDDQLAHRYVQEAAQDALDTDGTAEAAPR